MGNPRQLLASLGLMAGSSRGRRWGGGGLPGRGVQVEQALGWGVEVEQALGLGGVCLAVGCRCLIVCHSDLESVLSPVPRQAG